MKYIFIVFISILLIGCTPANVEPKQSIKVVKEEIQKPQKQIKKVIEIYDLKNLPQNPQSYLDNITLEPLDVTQTDYEKNYFRVWNKLPSDTKETAMWPFRAYKKGDSYGENLQLLGDDFFSKMRDNANFDNYKSQNKNALTLRHLSIRGFPTSKPLLHNPSLAGEGFPFDYMQNSTVSANKPILVSHYSKDKAWAYIFTSFTGGWVKASDIVIVDKKYTDVWQKAQQVFLIKDGVSIYAKDGTFLFTSRIGMMLALVDEDDKDYTVLTLSSYNGLKPLYLKSKISKSIAKKGIMDYNSENVKLIMSEISKSKYGWGGIYDQRDCSSTLRDFYAPFGLWLPRNSSQQAKKGNVIKIDNLSDEEKIKNIKAKAIPFKTFLYKKGHILLYVGTYNDTVVAFHNIWGIKTKSNDVEGRRVIGRAVFSSLNLGSHQEDFDIDSGILKNLKSINTLSKR